MASSSFHPAGWPVTHPTVRFWRRVVERIGQRLATSHPTHRARLETRLTRARARLADAETAHPDRRASGPLPRR